MTENLAGRGGGLAGLVEWLREQAEQLMKSAIARESTAETMRAATPKELREAKALAEKMAGRKLPNVSTGTEETKLEADVQCRIAAKLSERARRIAAWADELAALAAAAPASTPTKAEQALCEAALVWFLTPEVLDDYEALQGSESASAPAEFLLLCEIAKDVLRERVAETESK